MQSEHRKGRPVAVRNRSAVGILLSIVLIFLVIPAAGAAKGRLQIYVDANEGVDTATGTIDDPFATIGAAVAAVRSVHGGVDINVRAGTYADEMFPILIDANDRVIRGTASDGGQANPLIVARPVLPTGQAMIAVVADNVTLRDLRVDGGGSFNPELGTFPDRNYGIYIDTAQRFTVDGVTAEGTTVGVYARRSSGDVVDGTFTQNAVGIFIAAGDSKHQAAVRVSRNVVTLNCVGGAFFASTSMADVPVPAGVPLTTEALESSLDVELARNRISRNTNCRGAAGAQFFLHVGGDGGVQGSINAPVHDNVLADNGAHDLAIDSHRDGVEDTAPASFTGTFTNNVYSADASKRFIGFNFRFCETAPVTDSLITVVDPGGELAGFTYDATGARNTMVVNGVTYQGTNRPVACP
jgi:Protein of unknown function (DUF1565)